MLLINNNWIHLKDLFETGVTVTSNCWGWSMQKLLLILVGVTVGVLVIEIEGVALVGVLVGVTVDVGLMLID